jgi:hypothetical protein
MYPGEYLLQWCFNLPPGYGVYIAHLYLICTEKDMSPLFLDECGIRREFQNNILREDLPIRMAVRLTSAMSAIAFILECLANGDQVPTGVDTTGHQKNPSARRQAWREVADSFELLSQRLCGPSHVADWLRRALNGEPDID